MAKKCSCAALAALVLLLALYAAAVYIIDPYMHYHEPWLGMQMQRSDDSRYENYGLARFAQYDSIMLGTSVTQDAKGSEFNSLFEANAVKIKFAGSYFKELGDFLKYAYEHHEGPIDQVFWVLDLTHVLTSVDTVGHTDNPEYLYDTNFWNDSKYLLNKDVAPDLLRPLFNLSPVDHDHQVWNDPTGWETLVKVYGPNRPEQQPEKEFTPELRAQVLENYETNVLSIAREHPETQFYFIIPPGNAFFWDYVTRNGEYTCYMSGIETVMREMLALPNATVYNFVDDPAKTTDLNRYKDRVHFDPAMMSEIIANVAAGDGRITAENIDARMADMRAYWQNIDFDSLYIGYETEEQAQ